MYFYNLVLLSSHPTGENRRTPEGCGDSASKFYSY